MNKTGWIASVVSAVAALVVGFGLGWVGNQAYISASIQAAFEDTADEFDTADVSGDMEAMEDYEDNPHEVSAEELPEAVPMSESATDGIWDITITGIERAASVSGSYSNAVASDGWEFVILDVELVNASSAPQTPEIDNSEITDTDGSRFAYHSDAAMALDDDDVLYTDVNPGGTAQVRIPFEMETGAGLGIGLLTATWSDTGQTAAIEITE
ncbi:DUF4352 domain-containing protein [Nocardiopsis sp. MG754419]|uniref:DUF4352 domain-containing protein n=1 Tax=Nocardiopsis sp. MG754419 TaxID=2259865 RepID=UPI001BACB4A5|nr:DUF4352 domain-containing protein [Nocardiopsis sp. MG754419]MBR8741650.1 hypothetical protein [Nocardiopsis sp. MG754419]